MYIHEQWTYMILRDITYDCGKCCFMMPYTKPACSTIVCRENINQNNVTKQLFNECASHQTRSLTNCFPPPQNWPDLKAVPLKKKPAKPKEEKPAEDTEKSRSKLELKKRERDTKTIEKKETKPAEKKPPKEVPKIEGSVQLLASDVFARFLCCVFCFGTLLLSYQ